jgi:hypothetical protein
MTALVIIGFLALAACAIYVTAAAVSVIFGELAFSGGFSPLSYVLAAVAGCIWALVGWLSPFTISLGVA